MSSTKDGLILYLKLDDHALKDVSGQDNHGQIIGELDLVPDDLFGGSLMFDGQKNYVSVPNSDSLQLQGDLTLQAWVYISAENNNWVRIIGKGSQDRRNYGLWYHQAEKKWLFQQYGSDAKSRDVVQEVEELQLNTWHHLAAVRDQDKATLYINGIPGPQEHGFEGDPLTSDDPLTLGYAGFLNAHRGLIAHARLYNRALSADEIMRDMEAGKMALAAFRAGHPIDFSLYDEDDHYLIIISSDPDESHQLFLELHNISSRDIQLRDVGQTATAENHHFELRFRRGTLSPQTMAIARDPQKKNILLKENDLWDLHLVEENDRTSLYLLCKNPQEFFAVNGQEQTGLFLAGMRRTLQLEHISAAAGGGARSTQVEFIPRQLTHKSDKVPITGSRLQHLYIANHSGQKHIPLHMGFVGSNRILNDKNSRSVLIVQVMNIARPSQEQLKSPVITFQPENRANGKKIPASKLILSYDVAENLKDKPWALGMRNDLSDLKIFVTDHLIPAENVASAEITDGAHDSSWQREDPTHDQGVTKEWTLTRLQDKQLKRNECFFIYLSNIRSSLPSGSTNLTIHYKNIPGYWDGQFVLTIEKTPLLFYDNLDDNDQLRSKVGIGTRRPQAKLHVLDENRETYANIAKFEGPVKIKFLEPECTLYALYIEADTNASALNVDQSGSGDAATFSGNIQAYAWSDAATMEVAQFGSGDAARFRGNVQIERATDEESSEVYLRFKDNETESSAWRVGTVADGTFRIAYDKPDTDETEEPEQKNQQEKQKKYDEKTYLTINNLERRIYIGTDNSSKDLYVKGSIYVTHPYWGLEFNVADEIGYLRDTKRSFEAQDLELSGRFKAHSYEANYDSGWVFDDNSTNHKKRFRHNLNAFPALIQIYFTHELGFGTWYPVLWPWHHETSGNPVSIVVTDVEVILHITRGEPLHGVWHPENERWEEFNEGYWRVLLFRNY